MSMKINFALAATNLIPLNKKLTPEEQEVIRTMRATGYHDSAISGATGYCRATITKYGGPMSQATRNAYNLEHRLVRTSRYFANIVGVEAPKTKRSDNVIYLEDARKAV